MTQTGLALIAPTTVAANSRRLPAPAGREDRLRCESRGGEPSELRWSHGQALRKAEEGTEEAAAEDAQGAPLGKTSG
jgi:hypothetical protein